MKYEICLSKENKFEGFNSFMVFSPGLKEQIQNAFGSVLEVEFLQGKETELANGDIKILFNSDNEKQSIISDMIMNMRFLGNKASQN